MRNHWGWIIGLAVALGTLVHGAQSSQPAGDTFTWVGELVSLDPAAGKITVKSRVAYQEALSELKQFKAGEPVWVVWSGVSDHSEAVRQFRRPGANTKIADTLVTPAELVSPEATNQYVTLRVKVPEAGLAAIEREARRVGHRHVPAPPCERSRSGGGGKAIQRELDEDQHDHELITPGAIDAPNLTVARIGV